MLNINILLIRPACNFDTQRNEILKLSKKLFSESKLVLYKVLVFLFKKLPLLVGPAFTGRIHTVTEFDGRFDFEIFYVVEI